MYAARVFPETSAQDAGMSRTRAVFACFPGGVYNIFRPTIPRNTARTLQRLSTAQPGKINSEKVRCGHAAACVVLVLRVKFDLWLIADLALKAFATCTLLLAYPTLGKAAKFQATAPHEMTGGTHFFFPSFFMSHEWNIGIMNVWCMYE